MIYDQNTEKVRPATDSEKMFFEFLAYVLIQDEEWIDEDCRDYNVFAHLPYYNHLARGQQLSLLADLIRRSLDDEAEPFPRTAWADSLMVAAFEHIKGEIAAELDAEGMRDDPKSQIRYRWREPVFDITKSCITDESFMDGYKETNKNLWDERLDVFGLTTGLIHEELESLDRMRFVGTYWLAKPPSDWMGSWQFDAHWMFELGMQFETAFDRASEWQREIGKSPKKKQ